MPNRQKYLFAVELDITNEAISDGYKLKKGRYWVIHAEQDSDFNLDLCVFETKKEAREAAKDRDHKTRIVEFVRKGVVK